MRRAAFAVALLLLAGAAVWFLRPAGDGPRAGESGDPAVSGDGVPAPGTGPAAPGLAKGADETRAGAADPRGVRGRGAIRGVVRRDGAPVAAVVELHPGDPLYARAFVPSSTRRVLDRSLSPPQRAAPAATVRAGADGHYAFEGWGRGPYAVRAMTEDGARGYADAFVPVDGAHVVADVAAGAARETLRGRATHADGRPWVGTIVVRVGDGSFGVFFGRLVPQESAATDADGRFVVAGLPRGKVAVSALVPGVSLVTAAPIALPYEGEFAYVVDGSTEAATGRVVADADGKPIAGAEVAVGAADTVGAAVVARGVADAEGTFRFPVPPAARLALFVSAPGYAPFLRWNVAWTEPIEVRLRRGARIEGTVTSADGVPVAAAVVRLAPDGDPVPPYSGEAGALADGRYAIDDLLPGRYRVTARGSGWIPAVPVEEGEVDPALATLLAGATTVRDLRLVRGVRATGRVLDAEGAPVAGAVVSAERVRTSGGGDDEWALEVLDGAASAADGTFAIEGLRAGKAYRFEAIAPGSLPARSEVVDVTAEVPIVVELRFGASRRIEVTVIEETSGAPIEGASLTVNVSGGKGREDRTDRLAGSWTTSARGLAEVGPLPMSTVDLVAASDEHPPALPTPVPETATSAVVRLRRGLVLSGRVTRPDGTPAAGVAVATMVHVAQSWAYRTTTTEPDGAFRLVGLPEGEADVTASAVVSGRKAEAKGTFAAGNERAVLTLAFSEEASPERIVVRVLDGEGKPVPSATVEFFDAERRSMSASASDGTATLEVSERVAGTVEVHGARGADGGFLPLGPSRVENVVPGGPVVVVRLPPEHAVAGTVRDASGIGVAGARVSAFSVLQPHRFGAPQGASRSATDGAFRVGGLGEGEHLLQVNPPPGYVRPELVRAPADATGVEIVLRKGLSARVTVLDADGRPVRGVGVLATRPNRGGDPEGPLPTSATTDGTGVARLDGLPPDEELDLFLRPPRDRPDVRERQIGSWAPRDETVRLERAFTLRGRVVDLAGKPVPRASVILTLDDDSKSIHQTGEDGRFRIRDLPFRETVLRVVVGRWDSDHGQEFRVAPGTEETVLTLDPGLSLTVRVTGSPAPEVVRMRLFLEKDGRREEVDAGDGPGREALVFRGLRAGSAYSVWVHAEDGTGHALRTGLRGGDDVRVALTPGRTIGVRLRGEVSETDQVQVTAWREDLSAEGVRVSDGVYEIRGLPAGVWVVQAHAFSDSGFRSGTAKAKTGESVDVELVKAKDADDE